MKQENRVQLDSLIKVKKLKISELETQLPRIYPHTVIEKDSITDITYGVVESLKIECKLLQGILQSEGTR